MFSRKNSLIFLILLFVVTSVALGQVREKVRVTTGQEVPIFKEKDSGSDTVASAPPNAIIDLEEFYKSWAKVSVDGVIGYLPRSQVELVKKRKVIVTSIQMPKIFQNRRRGSDVVKLAHKNDEFLILKEGRNWVQVLTESGPGWISKKSIVIRDWDSLSMWTRHKIPILIFLLLVAGMVLKMVSSSHTKKKIQVT